MDRTITLPTLADNLGRVLEFQKLDTDLGKISVDGEGAETIDGQTSQEISIPGDSLKIIAGSTEWKLLKETRPLVKGNNIFINGNFDFWQRGSNLIAGIGKQYLADRFCLNTTTTASMSRQSFTLGQTDVPNEPKYFLRATPAVNPEELNISQRIEGVRSYAGKPLSGFFYVKGDANIDAITMIQNFGTGGSPSSEVSTVISNAETVTSSWKKIYFTVDIPSISGKTLGTGGDDYLEFRITTDTMQLGDNIDFAQFWMNKGKQIQEWSARSFQKELALCQRYYEKSYDVEVDPGSTTTNGMILFVNPTAGAYDSHEFKVPKFKVPTSVTIWDAVGNIGKTSSDTFATNNLTGFQLYKYGKNNFAAAFSASALAQSAHYTVETEL
jgi:hypothetical protein